MEARRFWICRFVGLVAVAVLVAACTSQGTPHASTSQDGQSSSSSTAPAVPTALVLDASMSMTEADAPGENGATVTRIEAARDAAGTLIESMPAGTQFTLLTYGTTAGSTPADKAAGCRDVTTLIPLASIDPRAAKDAVGAITPKGYTPIGLALQRAADNLPADGSQSIIVVSDGQDTCGVPSCDIASDLHRQRPDLTISTVGFRTDGAGEKDLSCIANATGGLFVTADDSAQLATRLGATQDLSTARNSLTSTGLNGAEIGQTADDIRATHGDLPAVNDSGEVVVLWRDCDLTFSDGVLTSIAPRNGARTVDGVTVGDPLSKAAGLYGDPVKSEPSTGDTRVVLLTADAEAGTAYKTTVDGSGDDATIKRIVLCRCLPTTGGKPDGGTSADATALTFGGTSEIQAGMAESDLASVGITGNGSRWRQCTEYTVPGTDLIVRTSQGKVKVVYQAQGGEDLAHTVEGIRAGDTAAEVRAAYKDAKLTEEFKFGPKASINIIRAVNDNGKAINFTFEGNSDGSVAVPDSAVVQQIRAGIEYEEIGLDCLS
ncbi:VWA domain-containing protein [Gordonia sp. HY442]|uniref:vWA domain-containing protein n=1 Tax=Gordonia zhenghanii TaxID=2911516 RepID=UPI001F1ABFEC|nr:VWA domain-containing protein [Gordonia zhenghanii]MCF8608309.1 VWA domain-containing protein [Gordonia zhenghanii]